MVTPALYIEIINKVASEKLTMEYEDSGQAFLTLSV
jgi:hypothetical protein